MITIEKHTRKQLPKKFVFPHLKKKGLFYKELKSSYDITDINVINKHWYFNALWNNLRKKNS